VVLLVVVGLGFVAGALCLLVLVDLLGVPTVIGGLVAAGLPPAVNYLLHANFVFKSRDTT